MGREVQRELCGLVGFEPRPPYGTVDLLALGRPDLLVSATRRSIVRWRDHVTESFDPRSAAG